MYVYLCIDFTGIQRFTLTKIFFQVTTAHASFSFFLSLSLKKRRGVEKEERKKEVDVTLDQIIHLLSFNRSEKTRRQPWDRSIALPSPQCRWASSSLPISSFQSLGKQVSESRLLIPSKIERIFSEAVSTFPAGYTNYQESSTDNCTGTASICTADLPFNITDPPDVWLQATVSVPSIELYVSNIQARLNLDAKVASLLTLTAGVSVGISSVQLKILGKVRSRVSSAFQTKWLRLGVEADVRLAVRFDKVVEIVNRTLDSIDLSPILAKTIQGVQNIVDDALWDQFLSFVFPLSLFSRLRLINTINSD